MDFIEAACAALSRQADDPPFRWLVFVDERSPDWLQDEIAILAPKLFEPDFTSEIFSSFLVSREVAACSAKPFLITTRLDSIAFISLIEERSEVAPKDRLFQPEAWAVVFGGPGAGGVHYTDVDAGRSGSNLAHDLRVGRVSPRRANELYDFDLPNRTKVLDPTLMRATTVQATRLISVPLQSSERWYASQLKTLV